MAEVNKLYLKIGTKEQYTSKKASLAEPAKTLALTPLASEFTSNTDNDGVLKFAVSGTTVTVSKSQVAKYENSGQNVGTTVNVQYVPYNSSTQSGYVPNFNWLAFWKGGYNTGGSSNLQYCWKGSMVGTGSTTTTTVGSTSRPVYVNNGTATQCSTPASGAWWAGIPTVSGGGVMEVGKYIDFHNTTAATSDYDVRIDCGAPTAARVLTLPDKTGTLMTTADFKDTAYTNNVYHSIYFAGADNTAGAITTVGMAAEATLSFNPSTKKFKYTTTDGTALNFGLTKVTSW